MAAASAAVKVGSFVREEAICSTRSRWNSGDSVFGRGRALFSFAGLDFVRSRVMVEELSVVERGTGPRFVAQRLDPEVSWSAWDGIGWLCSPS